MSSMFLALVVGALGWTLTEYCVHRWLGHHRPLMPNPFSHEHIAHHARGGYFAPLWKKVCVALIISAAISGPAALLAGQLAGSSFVIGFVGCYLGYELLHWRLHTQAGVGSYGRWARRHHFYHHFHDPTANHGVSSPIWDIVFGTRIVASQIRVPVKLAMPWLRAPDTGQVLPALRRDYVLR